MYSDGTIKVLDTQKEWNYDFWFLVNIKAYICLDDFEVLQIKTKLSSRDHVEKSRKIQETLELNLDKYRKLYSRNGNVLNAQYMFRNHPCMRVFFLKKSIMEEYSMITPAAIIEAMDTLPMEESGNTCLKYCEHHALKDVLRKLRLRGLRCNAQFNAENTLTNKSFREELENIDIPKVELQNILMAFLVQNLINPGEVLLNKFNETLARQLYQDFYGARFKGINFMVMEEEDI
jgi:hypothetical protein